MNKLWLIVKREYTTRVFKKSFILLTLLVPLAIVAFSVIVGFIMSRNTVQKINIAAVSYTHLRAHETVLDLVCRLLLEKNKPSSACKNILILLL